jgi:Ala-tRNA(Pro) deacylase
MTGEQTAVLVYFLSIPFASESKGVDMTIAARLLTALREENVAYETISHPKTYSSTESATAAHVDDAHIAKAVVLKDEQGFLLAVIPASEWLNLDRLREELNRELHLASEEEADDLFTDCQSGAFPPLGKAYGIETVLDQALISLSKVYFEAGDHEQLITVTGEQFRDLTKGLRRGHFTQSD